MKPYYAASIALIVLTLAYGCSSSDTRQQSQEPPAQNAVATPAKAENEKTGTVVVTPLAENTAKEDVVIPESVKTKWKTVGITVLSKQENKSKTLNVAIGSEVNLTDAPLKIAVRHFIPDFTMEGTKITSASDQPNNPAAYVIVNKDGAEIYRGWLFTRYPNMNKFEDPVYGLTISSYN